MKITKAHLDFWASRKAPKVLLRHRGYVPTIHNLINAQAEVPREQRDYETTANNLLNVLFLMRKRGALIDGMTQMARKPGTVINPEKRAAYCRRWLRKIQRGLK